MLFLSDGPLCCYLRLILYSHCSPVEHKRAVLSTSNFRGALRADWPPTPPELIGHFRGRSRECPTPRCSPPLILGGGLLTSERAGTHTSSTNRRWSMSNHPSPAKPNHGAQHVVLLLLPKRLRRPPKHVFLRPRTVPRRGRRGYAEPSLRIACGGAAHGDPRAGHRGGVARLRLARKAVATPLRARSAQGALLAQQDVQQSCARYSRAAKRASRRRLPRPKRSIPSCAISHADRVLTGGLMQPVASTPHRHDAEAIAVFLNFVKS